MTAPNLLLVECATLAVFFVIAEVLWRRFMRRPDPPADASPAERLDNLAGFIGGGCLRLLLMAAAAAALLYWYSVLEQGG